MERPKLKEEKEKTGKTVRFRVASANSGRVLAEVFKDERAWCGSVSESVDSDCNSSPEIEQGSSLPISEANSHLNGLVVETGVEENGCEPDDLLLYASAKREMFFSNKRINICSKNGTIRGVRNKVSAGQVLFNNLSNMYSVSSSGRDMRSDPGFFLIFVFLPLRVPCVIRGGDPGKRSEKVWSFTHCGCRKWL